MHYYQHHIGDFLKDTGSLTNEEIGIYLKLIWLYYDSEKPLPDNIELLCFKVNARQSPEIVKNILGIYFVYQAEYQWYTHGRIDKEVEAYHHRKDVAKTNISKRWNTNGIPMVNDLNTSPILTNNHEPITIDISPKKAKSTKKDLPDDFCISERVKEWSTKNSVYGLEKHFENFVLQARKQGYKYADWDSALMTAIRDNWAKVEKQAWA